MKTTNCCHLTFFSIILFFATTFPSCRNADKPAPVAPMATDTLTEEQKHLPENALKTLIIAEGLEVTPFATEPMLQNPTNIDVDERGRVWVTEAYNYRPHINGNPTKAEGDRIVVLEDTNGDGRADTSKVFYQGREVNAPLGVCVLENRVIVSQSPYVWAFYDDNGDDKADRKEVLFQGIGGEQHDHGVHAFNFAPDGKLYFTFGNEGKTLKDKNGKAVRDQDGDEIGPKKYREGMLFRCDIDGSNVECLGQNFRNNYEAAVDSYGAIWQSDNDDDGNRATRINYILQHGNYGFKDEMTGAGWQANRTNAEDSIPLRHWHLNDPGVVPNLLQTGAGSPTGMVIYEGSMLPSTFQNGMIHCDAGPNVVRAYPVKKAGAGFTADSVNILKNGKDQWFRPADICVAPDGSLIVADWYDPGVGGHGAGDQVRGRIYRVATPKSKYTIPTFDYTTVQGALEALQNPNSSVRFHAWTALKAMDKTAVPELEKLWKSSPNPRMRARAFWALTKITLDTTYLQQAITDQNPDIRMMGIRAATQLNANVINVVRQLANDPDVQVRRECILALHHNKSNEAATLWSALAAMYDGRDRWYLEALGIAADRQWNTFFTTFVDQVKDPLQNAAYRDVVWRARTEEAVPYIAQMASEETVNLKDRLRYFRAFDFNTGPAKRKLLLNIIAKNNGEDTVVNKVVLRHLDIPAVKSSPVAAKALKNVIRAVEGTSEYIDLVERYDIRTENNTLLQLAIDKPRDAVGKNAARLLLKYGGDALAWKTIRAKDTSRANPLLRALGSVGTKESIDLLQTIVLGKNYDTATRGLAARVIGKSWSGEERVLELLKKKQVQKQLIPHVVASVSGAWRGSIRTEAASYLPGAPKVVDTKAPTLKELMAIKVSGAQGLAVFQRACATCHIMNKDGFDFGPKLSEIGAKLPKEGLYEAIVYPSANISFGYEGWEIKMKDGSTLSGIVSSKTATNVDLKLPGGTKMQLKRSEVKSMKQLKESLMPSNLHQAMSKQELAGLLEYLANAKKKQ